MKVALLAPLRFPVREPFAGGLEAHTHLLATGLVELGHEVTLFAHPGSDPDSRIAVVPFRAPESAATWPSFLAYRSAVRAIAGGGFDVLHDNSAHWLPAAMAGSVPFPVVTTLHTPPFRTHRYSSWLARRAANHHFVSISDFLAHRWSSFVGEVTTIHNGIALAQFPFAPAAAPDTAIWYGRITPDKGTHLAIEAAVRANFKVTVAGPVEDDEYYNKYVKPLFSDDVKYVGHLKQQDLSTAIGRSSVGLVTSLWEEPFGLVCAELLACGTPVAAFDSGAVREVLTDEVAAVVTKGDAGALARVLGEVARRDRYRCRARAECFSAQQMVAAYSSLYTRVTT